MRGFDFILGYRVLYFLDRPLLPRDLSVLGMSEGSNQNVDISPVNLFIYNTISLMASLSSFRGYRFEIYVNQILQKYEYRLYSWNIVYDNITKKINW